MKKEKKILFLAHSQSIHTQRWIDYFIKKNWDVYIISFHKTKIYGANNINLSIKRINPNGSNFKYITKIFLLIYYIRKIKPTIINSHFLTSYGFFGFLSGHPLHVVNLYGSDVFLNTKKNIFYKYGAKIILNKAIHVFSVSDYMTKYIINNFGININKITTIQYGVDLNFFRNVIPINKRPYDFITNRTFIENSNYELILKYFLEFKKKKANTSLIIVGEGPLRDKILYLIKKYKLSNSIIFKDHVNPELMVELLNSAKIYLSLTSSDGTPLSLFEALACGLYPVLSNNNSNLEWKNKGLQCEIIDLDSELILYDVFSIALQNAFNNEIIEKNLQITMTYMNYETNMNFIENILLNNME